MSSKVEACPMCTQSCLMTHGNKTNSRTLVSSFFKVLIGDMFSTILYFPPKFAPTVSSLNGQETFLEDSSGQRWKVKVSVLNDSFVLQEGWSEFASDHGLELGDFIIFNYIMGSHFEVHIYDKSACERLDFSERRNQTTPNLAGEEICRGQSKLKNHVLKAKMVAKNTSTNKK
ncbi:B3 domain-containing protein [Salix suchowensis]|nr:B3 domain-containing protein [Salix suchowensis]